MRAMTFKAHVRKGRLVLDEPTDLPDGAEIELVAVDEMTDDERQALEQALAESEDDVQAGRVYLAADVIAELRRQ
jgi:hypothetical protein